MNQQLYIFPAEGVILQDDELLSHTWQRAGSQFCGISLDRAPAPVRRPVSPPLLQWVSYQDRKPTEADADDNGQVRVTHPAWIVVTFYPWDKPFGPECYWHPLLKASAIPKPDKSRAEFEAWATNDNYDTRRGPDGDYAYTQTAVAWEAWQAARKEQQP